MMLNVHYLLRDDVDGTGKVLRKAGTIISYQGGEDDSHNACPAGCGELKFNENINSMFDSHGRVIMCVDVAKKELALINPPRIPSPISS